MKCKKQSSCKKGGETGYFNREEFLLSHPVLYDNNRGEYDPSRNRVLLNNSPASAGLTNLFFTWKEIVAKEEDQLRSDNGI